MSSPKQPTAYFFQKAANKRKIAFLPVHRSKKTFSPVLIEVFTDEKAPTRKATFDRNQGKVSCK